MIYVYEPYSTFDAPQDSWMDSSVSPKVKITKRERAGACSLAGKTLGVEGRAGASR
jgi:hypothetical protein